MAPSRKVKFGPFSYHTWTVRMNPLEHEGRSVWEHCPIPRGTPVNLTIQTLPQMLCTIGQSANRRSDASVTPKGAQSNGQFGWVNKSILRTGPFPPGKGLLTVGCELHVIPGWQTQIQETTAAIQPPVFGSLEGIDVRPFQGHEVDRLQVWITTDRSTTDLIQPSIWLRHPSGLWSERHTLDNGIFPSVQSSVFDVSLRGADRLAVSFDFTGPPPSGQPVRIAYGLVTAPSEAANRAEFQIRFGGVVAPYE